MVDITLKTLVTYFKKYLLFLSSVLYLTQLFILSQLKDKDVFPPRLLLTTRDCLSIYERPNRASNIETHRTFGGGLTTVVQIRKSMLSDT